MNLLPLRSILFVCLGNICRSPTGEGVFQTLLIERGIEDNFRVDSAGTIGHHIGHPADSRMQAAAAKRGYNLNSRARKIIPSDLDSFDLVIAMDRENLIGIQAIHAAPRSDVRLLSDFLGDEWPSDVPDPYYGGAAGFETVLDMIEAACPAILEHLESLDR